jgi:hypothetical protein
MIKSVRLKGMSLNILDLIDPVKKANSKSTIIKGSVNVFSFVFMARTADSKDTVKNTYFLIVPVESLELIYAVRERRYKKAPREASR